MDSIDIYVGEVDDPYIIYEIAPMYGCSVREFDGEYFSVEGNSEDLDNLYKFLLDEFISGEQY